MNLLIVTQKVDEHDSVLGFFYWWIERFAKRFTHVTVICLELEGRKGTTPIPKNVSVRSLGKEEGVSKPTYFFRFFEYVFAERKNYDFVFVHMNPEYVLLGGWLWRLMGKKVVLWYTHGRVNTRLRVASLFAHHILTATKESCRLKGNKVSVVGHGIDTVHFSFKKREKSEKINLITVGRVSRIKDYETLIRSLKILLDKKVSFDFLLVGGIALSRDGVYMRLIKDMTESYGLLPYVRFHGSVSPKAVVHYLHKADIFIHTSRTGSLDKAILEAMSTGLPVISSNRASKEILGRHVDTLAFPEGDHVKLSQKIIEYTHIPKEQKEALSHELRNIVTKNHELEDLIEKIYKLCAA